MCFLTFELQIQSGAYLTDNLTHEFSSFFQSFQQNRQNDSKGVGLAKNKVVVDVET